MNVSQGGNHDLRAKRYFLRRTFETIFTLSHDMNLPVPCGQSCHGISQTVLKGGNDLLRASRSVLMCHLNNSVTLCLCPLSWVTEPISDVPRTLARFYLDGSVL